MMRGTMARLSKLVGLCSLVLLAGCFQIEQKFIVYSDGSGKYIQTVTMDPGQLEMLKNMAPPGAAGGGAPDITKQLEGTIGQKAQMVAIAYYEDISKVKQAGYTFDFKKNDDGGVNLKLDVDLEEIRKAAAKRAGGGIPGMGDGEDGGEDLGETPSGGEYGGEAPGGMGGMDPGAMEGLMSQMKQSIVLVLPGDVTSASVGEKNGRVVTYVMEGADMAKGKKITIESSCGAPTEDAKSEFEAFQKELDAAKQASAGSGDGK